MHDQREQGSEEEKRRRANVESPAAEHREQALRHGVPHELVGPSRNEHRRVGKRRSRRERAASGEEREANEQKDQAGTEQDDAADARFER